ncbi:MAG: hypothetical protein ACRES7_10930 [Gammaproteobacteria bacterium]
MTTHIGDRTLNLPLLCVVAVFLVIAGCVLPGGGHYYAPSAAGGKVVRNACGGNIGAPDVLEFTKNDYKLFLSAYKSKKEAIVVLWVQPPPPSHDVSIPLSLNGAGIIAEKSDSGQRLQIMGVKQISSHGGIWIQISIRPVVPAFSLFIPTIQAGTIMFPAQTAHFHWSFGTWPEVINC